MPLTKPSFKSIIRSKMTTWKMYLVCMEDQSRKNSSHRCNNSCRLSAANLYKQRARGEDFWNIFFSLLFYSLKSTASYFDNDVTNTILTQTLAHSHTNCSFFDIRIVNVHKCKLFIVRLLCVSACVHRRHQRFHIHLSWCGSYHLTGHSSFFHHSSDEIA